MRRKARKAKITPALAKALRAKRQSLGLTQQQLVVKLDLPGSTVSDAERCNPRATVSIKSLNRLCEYLEISQDELRRGVDAKTDPAQGSLDFTSAIRNPDMRFRPAAGVNLSPALASEDAEVREILSALMPVIQEMPRFASMSIVQKMKASV